ncbi:MAG TPA: caspase family protein, partial [Thermoanaerobaculia bacterium]
MLIGIDDYSASQFDAGAVTVAPRDWPNLYGAVNDVDAMREMLVARHGFADRDILVLKNHRATRAAILGAIEQHLATGDVALFYYAGHGSQVPNSRSTEPDKLDESLVPADSRAGAPDIRDKELRRLFNRILDRGARLTLI